MINHFLHLDERLEGFPDELLTVALITVAIALVVIAFRASPTMKALSLAWVVAP